MSDNEKIATRCGLVTIIGRPSVGKSTFLNTVCGGKVSIVSAIPQTTRNTIRGILTRGNAQILFLDTPGLHKSEKKFNEALHAISVNSLTDSDCVLYIIDSTRSMGEEEEHIIQLLQEQNVQEKLFVALNKVDSDLSKTGLILVSLERAFPNLKDKNRIFEISAKEKQQVDAVIDALISILPESPFLYPEDFYTDQDIRFRIAEIIREKAMLHTRDEIPHALYVSVDELKLHHNGKELEATAFIYVERESQKGIVVGKDGMCIKAIKKESLRELRNIFDYKLNIHIQVKLDKDWRKNDKRIDAIIY
ncbi:MAG: GTPase Era [Spirochaetaceae bacterium]|nr:GTPase Era [Spirochaetaceae bacterium]